MTNHAEGDFVRLFCVGLLNCISVWDDEWPIDKCQIFSIIVPQICSDQLKFEIKEMNK